MHTYSTERIFALKPSPSSICASSQIARSDTLNLKPGRKGLLHVPHLGFTRRPALDLTCCVSAVSFLLARGAADRSVMSLRRRQVGACIQKSRTCCTSTRSPTPRLTCSLSLLCPRSVCVFSLFSFFWRSPGRFRASLVLIALTERKTKRDVHAARSQRPIKRPQLFSIINRCATCCLSSHPAAKLTVKPVLCLFARRQKIKKRATSVTFCFSKQLRSALSMTSIKPNECGAQRVRPWDIRCAIRVSNQRRQPSALSGINRSAIGARRVVECA